LVLTKYQPTPSIAQQMILYFDDLADAIYSDTFMNRTYSRPEQIY